MVPPTRKVLVVQFTATVVTLAPPTLPVPPTSVQFWLGEDGCVRMVTAKAAPLRSSPGSRPRGVDGPPGPIR